MGPAPDVQTLNAHDVLRASDQAGYRWDVGAGTLAWSEAAAALLGLGADDLATVRAFARVLDPGTGGDARGCRAVERSQGCGRRRRIYADLHPWPRAPTIRR